MNGDGYVLLYLEEKTDPTLTIHLAGASDKLTLTTEGGAKIEDGTAVYGSEEDGIPSRRSPAAVYRSVITAAVLPPIPILFLSRLIRGRVSSPSPRQSRPRSPRWWFGAIPTARW